MPFGGIYMALLYTIKIMLYNINIGEKIML